MNYAKFVSLEATPQSEPLPGKIMVPNRAGGFAFEVTPWERLNRFLILGTAENTYYASARELTRESADCINQCMALDGIKCIDTITDVSYSGRAPKNDPAIFALAMACCYTNTDQRLQDASRSLAYNSIPIVCRTSTHLFQFLDTMKALGRGWGSGYRNAVARWYTIKSTRDLVYQILKYPSREGWSHRDVLRLCHPTFNSTSANAAAYYAIKGWPSVGNGPHSEPDLCPIWAVEQLKMQPQIWRAVLYINDYGLVRENLPTELLTSPEVWDALLVNMPFTAMLRNLATMTRIGLLKPLSAATMLVITRLKNVDLLRKARIHPLAILTALRTYESGHGFRGTNSWEPVAAIVTALEEAFYLSFQAVEPTNKRFLLGLDVSGSMTCGAVGGVPNLSPFEAAAAMALVIAHTEPNHAFVVFADTIKPVPLRSGMRLAEAMRTLGGFAFGGTDCALPILYAEKHRLEVDAFVTLTDSETWAGAIHPSVALDQYRQHIGIGAKGIAMGLTATDYSIFESDDAGTLNCAGFDTAVPAMISDFVSR